MSSATKLQKRNRGFYGSWRARGRRLAQSCALLALLGSATACVTTPVTGRQALNGFSIDQDKSFGAEAYAEVLSTSKLKDGGPEYAMTKRCTDRLIAVADDPGFDWEVHVIDDPATVNAWCMPGGKMAVYTGILPVTADETGLAVVMAHEIGHAVARHGTERLTLEMGPSIAIQLLGGENQALWATAQQYILSMPWGRKQELEADRIGLIYMARAGYDPRKAVEFWQRMSEQSQGAPPVLLSTHPADSTRIAQLQELLPEAMQIWQASAAGAPKP
jgi:predicted Zn-dependent protease